MAQERKSNIKSRVKDLVLVSQGEQGTRHITITTPEGVVVFLRIDLATGSVKTESFQS